MRCEIFIGFVINYFMISCQYYKVAAQAKSNALNEAENYAGFNDEHQNSVNSLTATIPGEPDSDYPTYKSIPRTAFSCKGRVNWGYYADIETNCQVFHVCSSQKSFTSFLCPIGSKFNQKHSVCEWWYNVNCNVVNLLSDDFSIFNDISQTVHKPQSRSDSSSSALALKSTTTTTTATKTTTAFPVTRPALQEKSSAKPFKPRKLYKGKRVKT